MKKIIFLGLIMSMLFVSDTYAREDKVFYQNVSFKGKILVNPATTAKSDSDGYGYLFEINDGGTSGVSTDTGIGKMNGTTADKTYGLGVTVSRPSTAVATGDSNDAALKLSYKNYSVNTSLVQRGINSTVHNRVGGTVTMQDNFIGSANRGTSPTVRGLSIRSENYGTTVTEFGGLDIELSNEGAVATTEYGLRIRNTNNSIADAIAAGIKIEDTGANTGYDYIIDTNGASVVLGEYRFSNGAVIYVGAQTTRNAVRTEVGTAGVIGSLYLSSAGKMYLKVATGDADTDWEKVTTSAAD